MNSFSQIIVIGSVSLVGALASRILVGDDTAKRDFVCNEADLKEDQVCLGDVPEGALWVDARSREEWEETGLEGSVLWNMDPKEDAMAMEAEAAAAIFSASYIVVFCGSEACGTSRQVKAKIESLGAGVPIKVLYGGREAIEMSTKGSN